MQKTAYDIRISDGSSDVCSSDLIISVFIFGGVFERFPELKLVCVEADAGWAAHFMYRMDHAYKRHRHWMKGKELSRLPSEWFRSNVWLTFQEIGRASCRARRGPYVLI